MRPPGGDRPLTEAEHRRHALLRVTRRQATGLLVVAAAVFVVSTVFVGREHWLGWVQAAAVASVVGGLADWFAVTALFRHPLGLPIPHTAIVVARKDRFGETLGAFVQESFLSPDAVMSRLRHTDALGRAATWMASEDNAAVLAERLSRALAAASELLRDEDVNTVFDSLIRERMDGVALAPVAGRALEELTRDGRHEETLDASLEGLSRYIHDHGPEMHERLGIRSPWWLPGPLGDRMVHRLLTRSETLLHDMASDRTHPLRDQLETGLVKLAEQMQTDEKWRRRGEEVKGQILQQPAVRAFATGVWQDLKASLREQADQPGSQLREWLAAAVCETGRRLSEDPELTAAAERGLDAAVRQLFGSFEDELAALVSGTISRWDAEDTSRRLELLLGPDLQYIRINGTVVGGLAGIALHAVSSVIH